jgi:hypothetical protein
MPQSFSLNITGRRDFLPHSVVVGSFSRLSHNRQLAASDAFKEKREIIKWKSEWKSLLVFRFSLSFSFAIRKWRRVKWNYQAFGRWADVSLVISIREPQKKRRERIFRTQLHDILAPKRAQKGN